MWLCPLGVQWKPQGAPKVPKEPQSPKNNSKGGNPQTTQIDPKSGPETPTWCPSDLPTSENGAQEAPRTSQENQGSAMEAWCDEWGSNGTRRRSQGAPREPPRSAKGRPREGQREAREAKGKPRKARPGKGAEQASPHPWILAPRHARSGVFARSKEPGADFHGEPGGEGGFHPPVKDRSPRGPCTR